MAAGTARKRAPLGDGSAHWFQTIWKASLLWFFLSAAVTCLITAPAVAQKAVDFDGRNDHITFGAAPSLALPQFTIECWFNRHGTGFSATTGNDGVTAVPLITKGRHEAEGSNLDVNYFLGINAAGRLTADFEDMATGANHPVTGTAVIANRVWYHAAATYDGTTWRIYLNGNLEAESAANATPRFDSIQHAGVATAMTSSGAAAGYFDGAIDEVRIWDYARTRKEVAESKDLQITMASGLVGRWGLNEGSGTAAANSVTGGVSGILTNGPHWAAGYPFPALPTQPPSAPAAPLAAAADLTITLTWTDTANNEAGFEIQRSDGGGLFSLYTTAGPGSESFVDKALTPGTEYCYRVRAFNAAGASDGTAAACASTPAGAVEALYFDGVNDHVVLAPAFSTGGSGGVLIRNPTHPRYLARAGSDAALYMTGSHTWSLIQTDDAFLPTYQALEYYLDWVQSFGHNFIRVWANFSYQSFTPAPWNMSAGLAVMDSFNQAYFDQLRERVLQITRRGMHCSVTLFGSAVKFSDPADWETVWWNPNNNSSPVLDAAFSTTDGDTFFTSDPAAMALQKAFADKVIDTLNDQDLLFWEIMNEPKLPESAVWQNAMMAHIRAYEATKPKQHLIMMSGEGTDPNSGDEAYLFGSTADIVSPDNLTPYTITEGGNVAYTAKLVINDSDHIVGWSDPYDADLYRKWVWRAFTRGTHPIFMDSYDDNVPLYNDGSINPAFDPVRAAMGHTRSYAGRMDLRYALPSSSFSSSGYALVHPGSTYLIYQPGTGPFTYTLPSGDYRYEWFNPTSGQVTETGAMSGGLKTSTPPSGYADAVLFIRMQGDAAPAPDLGLAAFTVECRFRRDGAGVATPTGAGGISAAVPLVAKGREEAEGGPADMNWFLGIDHATNRIAADFEDNATGTNHPVFGVTSIANGVWYHAAATYDGATWRLYLNGSLEGQSQANATPRLDSIQPAAIATALNSAGAAAGFFKGAIDEVRIWSYARTPKEITDGKDVEIASAVGLVGRWGLSEGTGFIAGNSVSGGLEGRLVSGPVWVPGCGFADPPAPPAAPSNPSATTASASAVDLIWKDNAGNEETFEVERSASGAAGPFFPRAVLGAGAETYRDSGLEAETEHCYRVRAVNAAGGSAFTEAACAATPPAPAYALDFGGGGANTGTYVTFGQAPGLGLAAFTLECWFRRDGTGTPADTGLGGLLAIPLVTKGRDEGDGGSADMNYFLGIRSSDNVLAADFEDMATGQNHPIAGVTPLANGIWYHAAATYDGGKWQLFLNGRLEAESIVGAAPRADTIQQAGLGAALNSTGLPQGYFDGAMDEVRIWDYARSQAEIGSTINTAIKTALPGLAARWGLDEGSGASVSGGAGTNVSGTIVNAAYAWVAGAPFDIDLPPALPVLVAPGDEEAGVDLAPELAVAVSDPEGQDLAVSFYGRPKLQAGGFELIGTAAAVSSGASVAAQWPGLDPLVEYEWYATVSDGARTTTGPIWSFTTTGIPGDIDGDCDVDGSDLAELIAAFNLALGQPAYNAGADIEPIGGDGDIDGNDLYEFTLDFGTLGCP